MSDFPENDDPEFSPDPLAEEDSHNFELDHEAVGSEGPAQALEARIAELEEDLAKMKDQAVRALADAENTRKRAQKDREDAMKFSIAGFARDLLPVADNLRRALDAIPHDQRQGHELLDTLYTGVEATERELLQSFEKHGIRKISPTEQDQFDPNLHEAMFETPVPGATDGSIIQTIETGYELKGRLLRPARVGVAKGVAGSADTGPADDHQNSDVTAGPSGSNIDTQA